jgi:hypothetical protein
METIDLSTRLDRRTAFVFPVQSRLARRELLRGAALLLLHGVGWLLNMGHRIQMVHNMQHGRECWPGWGNYPHLLKLGTVTFLLWFAGFWPRLPRHECLVLARGGVQLRHGIHVEVRAPVRILKLALAEIPTVRVNEPTNTLEHKLRCRADCQGLNSSQDDRAGPVSGSPDSAIDRMPQTSGSPRPLPLWQLGGVGADRPSQPHSLAAEDV